MDSLYLFPVASWVTLAVRANARDVLSMNLSIGMHSSAGRPISNFRTSRTRPEHLARPEGVRTILGCNYGSITV